MRKYLCAPPEWYLTVLSWNYTDRKYPFQYRQTIRQYYQRIIHRILSRNNYTQPSAACTPWKPAYVGFSAAWQQAVSKCMGSGKLMLMRFSFCISLPHMLHLPAQENHSWLRESRKSYEPWGRFFSCFHLAINVFRSISISHWYWDKSFSLLGF